MDYSITTIELAELIKRMNIDFDGLQDGEFDMPLGDSSGAGAIFGTTGGVMEAALRTVYEEFTGKELAHVEFEQVRGLDGIHEAVIDLDGFELKVCVVNTLANARIVMVARSAADSVRAERERLFSAQRSALTLLIDDAEASMPKADAEGYAAAQERLSQLQQQLSELGE